MIARHYGKVGILASVPATACVPSFGVRREMLSGNLRIWLISAHSSAARGRQPEGKSHSIEQALFGHGSGHPGCGKISDDFAGLEIAQLWVFNPISFLAVTIESKAIFDETNVLSIFIKMTRHPLPPMLPLCRLRLEPPILIDHPALSPFFVVWRGPESDVLISNSTRSRCAAPKPSAAWSRSC